MVNKVNSKFHNKNISTPQNGRNKMGPAPSSGWTAFPMEEDA